MPFNCVKCGSEKIDPVGDIDFISKYPGKIGVKCGDCQTEYTEEYLMNQKVQKEKGKTKIVRVDPKNPDKTCLNCKEVHVNVDDLEIGADSVGVQISCPKCKAKYEENFYLNKIFDKNGKELKPVQQKIDTKAPQKKQTKKSQKGKSPSKRTLTKTKPKPKNKTETVTKTVAGNKVIGIKTTSIRPSDLDKAVRSGKKGFTAENKYIKSREKKRQVKKK